MGRGPCSTEPPRHEAGRRQRNHGSRLVPVPPRPGRFALPSKLLLLAVVSSSSVWSKRKQATSDCDKAGGVAGQGIKGARAVPESTAGRLAAVVKTGATVEIATLITDGLTGLKVRAADHSHRMLPCPCHCQCLPTQQASSTTVKSTRHEPAEPSPALPCSPAATCMCTGAENDNRWPGRLLPAATPVLGWLAAALSSPPRPAS
jgi:hypothetical protein